MAQNFGPGVSRTLTDIKRQFSTVVWQTGKPPLDSELNLMSQIDLNNLQQLIQSQMPSGFIMDPTRPLDDYQFHQSWASFFKLGNPNAGSLEPPIWANVNGWIIPVTGTNTDELANVIGLYPPPAGANTERIDLVFLEAWACRVNPNPSTVNKPSASTIYTYGNTQFGGANQTDDIEDPSVGFETTARIQVQYRIRVFGQGGALGASVALDLYPDGLGDPNVKGQGAASTPVSSFYFTNMGQELGDPSLWRAGDGVTSPTNPLGTLDGYTYAIPICVIFRRNTAAYEAVDSSVAPNQNGAFYRTPSAGLSTDPLDGVRVLATATTSTALPATTTSADTLVYVTNFTGSGFDEMAASSTTPFYMVLGNEIILITAIDTVANTVTIPGTSNVTWGSGRARFGSSITQHSTGTVLNFYNTRPDGYFADQIASTDILDLRHAVNTQDWDYYRLLEHNVMALVKNELRSTWKSSATGNTEGVSIHEVDILADSKVTSSFEQTERLDGPDGVRTIWSDAASIQPDVTLLLDCGNTSGLVTNFTSSVSWDVDPGFSPWGWVNSISLPVGWTDGSLIFLATGGPTGTEGARGSFKDSGVKAVRTLMPPEFWKTMAAQANPPANEYPVSIRFEGMRAFEGLANIGAGTTETTLAARHPGPMAPWSLFNFEKPFIILGAVLNNNLSTSINTTNDLSSVGGYYGTHQINLPDFDFDTAGIWYTQDDNNNFQNDPTLIAAHALNGGTRTLYGMLTNNGADNTGASSEVYIVLWGDATSRWNNGVFKVIGAGTVGYTTQSASSASQLRVIPLYTEASNWTGFVPTNRTISIQCRAQYSNSFDASLGDQQVDDICIGLTDLLGTSFGANGNATNPYPWDRAKLGFEQLPNYDLSMPYVVDQTSTPLITNKLVLNMTLLYHPGRSGFARVPDDIVRFAKKYGADYDIRPYLRQSKAVIDPAFAELAAMPPDETYWDPVHIQTWNRLPSCGLSAPFATYYGGGVVGGTEQDREHELFIDRGSKTVIFRPFRKMSMTLAGFTEDYPVTNPSTTCLLGDYYYATYLPSYFYKDQVGMFTNGGNDGGKCMSVAIPKEYMPRFGRQDIPYWTDVDSAHTFLCGINHLFADNIDYNDHVFKIIGGEKQLSGVGVKTQIFYTKSGGADYGKQIDLTGTGVNTRKPYVARKSTDISALTSTQAAEVVAKFKAVRSSDLGVGLKGIQLPPYYGVARLLGVYTLDDYVAKAGRTFNADRATVASDPAPNLLKEDACQQTLFIMQGGACDLTHGEANDPADGRDDHTYIIPSNVLDLTRALTYVEGSTFETFQYVVETEVFGFARGFINKNNYVLIRYFDGRGASQNDIPSAPHSAVDYEIDGINMIIPCAAAEEDILYAAYNRTAYQGNVYVTSGANSDYLNRYGQIPTVNQWEVETPIQQYFNNGDPIPEVNTPKAFEVLASMDFYTTYGTGKIGGRLLPSTYLDTCYTENTYDAALRKPLTQTSNPWRVLPRTFTAGQTQNNTARASVIFSIENYLGLLDKANPLALSIAGLTSIVGASGIVTVTTSIAHGLTTGSVVTFARWTSTPTINGDQTIIVTGATTFTFVNALVGNPTGILGTATPAEGRVVLRFNIPNIPSVELTSYYDFQSGGMPPTPTENYWPLFYGFGANVYQAEYPVTGVSAPVYIYPGEVKVFGPYGTPHFTALQKDQVTVIPIVDSSFSTSTSPDYVNLLDFEPIINPSTNDVFVVIKHKDTATPFRYPATLTDPNHSYPVVQKTITIPATGTLPTIPPLDFITTQIPFAGVSGTPPISNILLNLNDIEITQKLAIDVVGTGTDSITVRVFNFTSTPYSEAVTLAATATLFEEIDATEERVDLSFNISLVKTSYENNVTENMYWTMLTLANKINTHPVLSNWVRAEYEWQGSSSLQIYSTVTGEISKQLSLDVFHTNAIPASPVPINNDIPSLMDYVQLKTLKAVNYPGINNYSSSTKANFNVYDASEQDAILTKIDSPINAGDGASPISLTGITERLPLGILLQDSDFLCEDPLNDNVSGMKASPAVLQPIQNLLVPTQSNNYQTYISNTASGEEYDRFTGEPGILLTLSEGTASPIIYTPYTDITPTGTRLYRTYRGSTAFVLSGTKPGGPIDWVAGAFPAPMRPVLKGGLLACRALLVRGFIESSMQPTPFYGDEIQMVMLTYGILGNTETRTKGISMHGTISPTGYGEGYAAADRYRIGGHPMFRAFTRKVPDPATVAVAPYPERRIY